MTGRGQAAIDPWWHILIMVLVGGVGVLLLDFVKGHQQTTVVSGDVLCAGFFGCSGAPLAEMLGIFVFFTAILVTIAWARPQTQNE